MLASILYFLLFYFIINHIFFISSVGFKMHKSKDIKLSLILLTILFTLGNLVLCASYLIGLKI